MSISSLVGLVRVVALAHFVCGSSAPLAFAQELVPDTAIEIELAASDPVLTGHGPSRAFPYEVTFEGTLHVWAASSELDPILRITDSDGTRPIEDDNSGGGTTAYLGLEVGRNELPSITVAAKACATGKLTLHISESPETDATRAAAKLADERLVEAQGLRQTNLLDAARELLKKTVDELHAVEGARTSAMVPRASSRLWSTAHGIGAFAIARDALVPYVAFGERTVPADHSGLEGARHNLALTLYNLGDLPGARALQEQVLEVRSRTLPDDHVDLNWARHNLANTLYKLGDLPGARALQDQVLEVRSRTLSDDHFDLQAARGNLANTLYKLGELTAAHALQEKVLEVRSRTLPDDHTDLQWARHNLALTLYSLGDFPAARALQEKVLEVRSRILPDDHTDLQGARFNLAATLFALGDLHAARALQEQVLEVRSRTLPDDHADLQHARGNLAVTLWALGDLSSARALQEQMLEVCARTLPGDHIELQRARGNLANTLQTIGDLPAARALEEQVIEVCSRTLSDDDPYLQKVRGSLATTLYVLGDRPAARVLQEKVLEVLSRALPDDHRELQRERGNLASMLLGLGDLPAARALQEQVIEVLLRTLPGDHPQLQVARENLAVTRRELGDLTASRALQEQVLEVYSRTLPEDHPYLQRARANLALTLRELGDLSAARALQEQVLEVFSRTLPDDPSYLRMARNSLAWTCAKQGEVERCAQLLSDLARSLVLSLDSSLAASPREAGERIAMLAEEISTLLSLSQLAAHLEPTIFGSIETGRDRAVPSALARIESDPEIESMVSESRELRGRIQNLVASAATENSGAGRAEAISDLVRQRDAVEAKLRQALVERGMVAPPIELDLVGRALPEQTAAAGVRRYTRSSLDPEDPSKPEREQECLVAFVVTGSGALRRVELGVVDEIAAAARRWRAAVGKPLERGISMEEGPDDERAAGDALRALVLDPLLAAAGDVEALHICLDDALHLVPLDSLPMGEGLVGDRLQVHVESSFGRLIRHREQTEGDPSLLAIGGVDFNAEVGSTATAAASVAQSVSNDRPGPLGTNLAPLAQTRAEAENLGELFLNVFEREPVVLTGKKATKTALVDGAGGASFVHVATHGYFAPEGVKSLADPQPNDSPVQRMTLEETVTGLAPMALCGLALAGANRGVDALGRVPGIITAEEIAGLDLSSCELAVLSACETNVGTTRAGQGLQSLQAALHAAGARTAITSLWKVDDEATRELFEDFYTRIWVKHEPKSEALWSAKMALRKAGRPTRDWAAWVLSGNPD